MTKSSCTLFRICCSFVTNLQPARFANRLIFLKFCAFLKNDKFLKEINVRRCNVGDAGLEFLFLALRIDSFPSFGLRSQSEIGNFYI